MYAPLPPWKALLILTRLPASREAPLTTVPYSLWHPQRNQDSESRTDPSFLQKLICKVSIMGQIF